MIRLRTGIQLSLVALGMFLFTGLPDLLHAAQHYLRIISPPPYTLGDTLEVSLDITIASYEAVIAASGYITLDPDIFFPVLWPNGQPFKETALLGNASDINSMHGDSLHLPHDANSYTDDGGRYYNGWGWQLSYFQQTLPETPRRAISDLGPVSIATFRFVVEDLPPSDTISIGYEYNDIFHRNSQYHTLVSGIPVTGIFFSNMPYTLQVPLSGVAIRPALPDTVVIPGNGLDILLSDHFSSNVLDSTTADWSISFYNALAGPAPVIINNPGPNARLQLSTGSGDKYIIEANLALSALDTSESPDFTYYDDQDFTIVVDYVPTFIPPVDTTYTLDEDVPLKISGKGSIFNDADDNGLDFTARLEPDSLVHVTYGIDDSLVFYSDTNAYGSQVARLYIEDALGISIDTVLYFTVNAVNDTPVVSFDSVSALGDTLVIHRSTPDTLDLSLFATDVDDAVLTLSIDNPDPANLSVTLLPGGLLRLEADSLCPFQEFILTITATDDEGAGAGDTLVVSVRSWPPEIGALPDIKLLAGTPDTLYLNPLVSDNDTPDALMTWSFQVVDFVTGLPDPQVDTTYNQATQTVIFNTLAGYAATDLLILTVQDDDYNTDIDTARLFIFDDDGPMIFPLPALKVYRDSTHAGILDLDDYVADLLDDPTDINWSYTGGDSLESFSINSLSREVTITTNSTFIGNLIISLVATNSRGLRDTSDLAILVSRLVDGPPLWYAVPDEVEVVYGWTTDLFNYRQVCYDETPTDQIIFTPFYNTDSLTVLPIVLPDSVKLETPISDKKYTTRLYFTAEDELGNVSSSDTITVNVKDSFSPVWQRIPIISLKVGGTSSGLFLWDYVDDRDTPDNLLTIDVVNLNPFLTVSYNSVTTELTVSASVRTGTSRLSITATDDKGNMASTLVNVVVFAVADYTPPEGGLTYFFNPVADRWIHYVVTADSSTDISRFTWHYAYGSPPRDWSDHLSFVMKDTLPGTVTWIAPYHFQNEGSYALSVEITDATNNMLDPSPSLLFSVGFSKAIGGVLASPDRQLTVSYPPAPIPNGNLLIIAEDSLPVSTGLSIAKTLSARGNEENGSQVPAMVYSLDTNLPEPILVTLTYHQKRDTDPYYSFYELDGDQLVKIETYTSADGHFEAAAKLDRDIVFAPSDAPARDAPLPGAELFCYPNPFNATIQVRFLLRWQDQGRIVIYDLLGREVYASPRQPLEPGVHAFSWHSIDKRGLPVPSGTYFIRLETDGSKVHTRKVTLLK